jgi:hypothetical protein
VRVWPGRSYPLGASFNGSGPGAESPAPSTANCDVDPVSIAVFCSRSPPAKSELIGGR